MAAATSNVFINQMARIAVVRATDNCIIQIANVTTANQAVGGIDHSNGFVETVSTFSIHSMNWSCPAGNTIIITRANSSVNTVVWIAAGTGNYNESGGHPSITDMASSNLSLWFSSPGDSSIILELRKNSQYNWIYSANSDGIGNPSGQPGY